MKKRLFRMKAIDRRAKSPAGCAAAQSFSHARTAAGSRRNAPRAREIGVRVPALLLVLLFAAAALTGCGAGGRAAGERYEIVYEPMFDTVCSFSGSASSKEEFYSIAQDLGRLLKELDGLYSIYENAGAPNLKSVNDAAGGEAIRVDPKITDLLRFSLEYSKKTKGALDVTCGAVYRLWKEAQETGQPPEADELRKAAEHTGKGLLEIDAANDAVRLTDTEARIDVGAVAKGYAARLARAFLKKRGAENWLLSLGGNIVASGVDPRTGAPWTVGVRDPFNENGVAAAFSAENLSVVTSGSYERYFEFEGKRYHHIIDPSTLFPAERAGNVSVTVFSTDPARADALSTALFILNDDEGEALLEEGESALIIKEDGRTVRLGELPPEYKRRAVTNADAVVIALILLAALTAGCLILTNNNKAGASAQTDVGNGGGHGDARDREEPGCAADPGQNEGAQTGSEQAGSEQNEPGQNDPEKSKAGRNSPVQTAAGETDGAEKAGEDPQNSPSGRSDEPSGAPDGGEAEAIGGKARFAKKDLIFVIGALVLAAAALCVFFISRKSAPANGYAVVRVNGEVRAVLPLDENKTVEISANNGINVIAVENGKVFMKDADCKNKDCVRMGAIDGSSLPSVIACLPHGLSVSIEREAPPAAENGETNENAGTEQADW